MWQILIGTGLGPLFFGQPLDDALAAATAYGPHTEAPRTPTGSEIFEILRRSLSEEGARDAMGGMEVDPSERRLFVFDSGVHLTFRDGLLEDVMLDDRATDATLQSQRIFDASPFPVLRLLEAANGARPLLEREDLYFQNIHTTAFQFLSLSADGQVKPTALGTDASEQKTLSWRSDPRAPNETFDGHTSIRISAIDTTP